MERKVEIDRLKGIAILLVIIGHIYCKSMYIVDHEHHPVFNFIKLFHMPFFMFLSGLVIAIIPSFRKCIVKCMQLLMPAFTVGLLIVLFTNRSIGGMLMSNMKYGYWYLYTLALFYWILTLYKWINRVKQSILGGAIWIAQSILITLLLYFAQKYVYKEISDILSLKQAVLYFPYFITGVIISRYNLYDRLKNQTVVYTIAIIVLLTALCFTMFRQYPQISALHGLTPIAIIALLLCIAMYRNDKATKVEKYLEKFGKQTLDIYIYHYFIVLSIHLQQIGTWFTQTQNFLLEFIFCTLASFGISFLAIFIGKIIGKSPLVSAIVYGRFISYNCGRIEWKGINNKH